MKKRVIYKCNLSGRSPIFVKSSNSKLWACKTNLTLDWSNNKSNYGGGNGVAS